VRVLLLHGKRVHVGAHHQRGAVAGAAQVADHARHRHAGRHLVSGRPQPLGHDPRRAMLLEPQLGVAMEVAPRFDEEL
jgi:hypothetical protein